MTSRMPIITATAPPALCTGGAVCIWSSRVSDTYLNLNQWRMVMTYHRDPIIMSLPPPERAKTPTSGPSALAFLSRIVLLGIAVVLAAVMVTTVPRNVFGAAGLVLLLGGVVAALIRIVDRLSAPPISRSPAGHDANSKSAPDAPEFGMTG